MLLRQCTAFRYRGIARQVTALRLNSTVPNGGKKRTPIVNKITSFEALEPYWSNTAAKLAKSNARFKQYTGQFKKQVDKAKLAIQDANRRLAEEENSASDARLGFDTDVETKGKIEGLPSERERSRTRWARKLEFYFDSLQETIFTATKALNDVTGYSSIQKLRNSIDFMEKELEKAKIEVRGAKETFSEAIAVRTESQREVNELLQRKNSWSAQDLERFTNLYKDDSLNLKREEDAKRQLHEAEAKEEDLSNSLYRAILTRYHEEQIWSDKIRRTSTWGTFILMGMNILLFLVFQLLLEPWKRRRLVGSFEDKVKQALDQQALVQNNRLNEMSDHISTTFDKSSGTPSSSLPITASSNELENAGETSQSTHEALLVNIRSWSDLSRALGRGFHLLVNWTQTFIQKLNHVQKTNLNSSMTMTTGELYVYSIVMAITGYVAASWI